MPENANITAIYTEKSGNTTTGEENYSELTCQELYRGVRGAAIRILSRVDRSDSYLDKQLEYELTQGELTAVDKALLIEITSGVMRWQAKLDWILTGFYHGEYIKCITPVRNAMRTALYQILFIPKIPVQDALQESLEIIHRIKGERSATIVAGVLKNILRHINDIRYPDSRENPVFYNSVVLSHPQWLVKRWTERFGQAETEKLLAMNNQRPRTTLRINSLKATHEQVIEWLNTNKIANAPVELLKDAHLHISSLAHITSSELFKNGWVTLEDASTALALKLADIQPDMSVIDLCSSPGTRAFHLAEKVSDAGKITAIDKYESRLRIIENEKKRLGISRLEMRLGDATKYGQEEKADIVIVGTPSSNLGQLSRKPDIKWKREPEQLLHFASIQKDILKNAAKLVKDGGILLYTVRTFEPEETTHIAEWFLKEHPDFTLDPAEKYLPEEMCKDGFMQLFPHIHNTDGAFAARFLKIAKKSF
ncbi:MAG: 16S rRNA (cytosine(967)-C(5))-methyltransferase RsmB [Bacteroidota bacterium]